MYQSNNVQEQNMYGPLHSCCVEWDVCTTFKCCPKKIKRCAFFQCTEFTKSHHRSASKSQPLKEAFLWHAMVNGSHLYHSKKSVEYIIYLYKYRAPAERGRNSLKDLRIILDLLMSNLSMSNSSFPRHQSRHGLPQTHWWRLVWDAIFDLVACSLRVSGSVAPVAMTNHHLWGIAAHLIKNQVWDRKRCITHSVNKDRSLLWPRVLGLGSWCTFLQKLFSRSCLAVSCLSRAVVLGNGTSLALKTHTVAIKDWAGLHFEVCFCQFKLLHILPDKVSLGILMLLDVGFLQNVATWTRTFSYFMYIAIMNWVPLPTQSQGR